MKRLLILSPALLLTGCVVDTYNFDALSKEGFTIDGIYNGGLPEQVEECSQAELTSDPYYWLSPDSSTNTSDPDAGSLSMRIVPTCFPDTVTTGFWRFDFVSPDLEGVSAWQNLDEIRYGIKTNLPGIQTQPVLHIRYADGDESYLTPSDGAGGPLFYPLTTEGWQQITFNLRGFEEEFEIIEFRMRVFGEVSLSEIYWGPEALVNVDNVRSYRD